MEWLDLDQTNCSIRRTLDLVGEKWSLLIVRDAVNGVRRFDDFRRHIGLSEAVLADRLRKLVAADILQTQPYRETGSRTRLEYRMTTKGWDLWPVLMALLQWGDKHNPGPDGPPLEMSHTGCGSPVTVVVQCSKHHSVLTSRDIDVQPGPGARYL